VLEAVLGAQGLGLLPAGGRLVRVAGGGGLAQQGGDDAPDARQVAASGAGPLAVGTVRRRPALLMLLVPPIVAPAAAGPLGAGLVAALLVTRGAPVLTPQACDLRLLVGLAGLEPATERL
jgi:hypothetical protein